MKNQETNCSENEDKNPLYYETENFAYTIDHVKRMRNRTNNKQLDCLESTAKHTLKPNRAARIKLGQELGMTPRQVQIWFQNKRAKLKKKLGDKYKTLPAAINKPMKQSQLEQAEKAEKNDHPIYSDHAYGGLYANELYKQNNYSEAKDPYEEYYLDKESLENKTGETFAKLTPTYFNTDYYSMGFNHEEYDYNEVFNAGNTEFDDQDIYLDNLYPMSYNYFDSNLYPAYPFQIESHPYTYQKDKSDENLNEKQGDNK